MKKILVVALLALGINAKAQVVFEHDYDTASTFASGSPSLSDQLELIHFEVSGDKYVKISRHEGKIMVYDLNHALLKTIDCSGFPGASSMQYVYILYLSESLFDTDSGIEFMYLATQTSTPPYVYTGIYNDDGSLIFSDTAASEIFISFPSQQYPIYNTTQGTKMILSYKNGHAKVFGLVGTLSTGIQEANGQLMQAQGGQFSNLYPNPSNGAVTLQYALPKGEKEGEIILYNMQGSEVKRYKVDDTFTDIILDNTQLPAGTYFYQLTTSKRAVGTKKMIVVKK